MQVTIAGAGYVGLTTGTALAFLGHQVTLVDKNIDILDKLRNGEITIYEQGLEQLMNDNIANITFASSFAGVSASQVVIIAVGTPCKNNGDADLSYLENAVLELSSQLKGTPCPLLVNKSTVPPGTARRVKTLVQNHLSGRVVCTPGVASNPEFLREGNALIDALYPDRIVVGADSELDFELLQELYEPILKQNFVPPAYLPRPQGMQKPVLFQTDPTSAELIKYAANAFLAIKISFINEFAGLAELLNGDIGAIARGIGLDRRIGHAYLQAGVGWGGSCFGKDARAITYTARKYGYSLPLVEAALAVNDRQRQAVVWKLHQALKAIPGSNIGILGLAFKPDTDDVRDTPAADVIRELLNLGAHVKAFDPMATENFKINFPGLKVEYHDTVEDLVAGCDALVLLTEWGQFTKLPWPELRRSMRHNVFIDGRNCLDEQSLVQAGLVYLGMGRRTRL
ncbi:MAG TPA: UDP-glucose/GDP-mannose dehydrogenase family protein [Desulfotomaculum sp.]|nr:MAG: UDP-glucose 6-dehydrogenase [Peptococcaceae bacterium BRH_c8a]KJS71821.1 MAG: UDP-glucose 6-dehydrogenase [Desulfotomaculum sp. BICA1-6]HBX23868.1 UDP-glucose/GDP-mannose dehydrogenase family protein [Desulfotomaculum sp.]